MIIRKACKNKSGENGKCSYIGLDDEGNLWTYTGLCSEPEEWTPVLFNEMYQDYYQTCRFTAICATKQEFVAAGIGEDGLPYVFRSMMGGIWERVNLICGNPMLGYQRAEGKIVEILYEVHTKQFFMLCENGELLTLPDCPKCAKINRVSEERIIGGYFSEDGSTIIIITDTGKEEALRWNEVSQIRGSSDFAEKKIKEGGILIDLRNIDIDTIEDWLSTQEKERCIFFLCNYGIQSDQAARFARRKGYHQAYSLGGERLKLY